jgi:4-aminobutyrate aminotransferase-like enzyme
MWRDEFRNIRMKAKCLILLVAGERYRFSTGHEGHIVKIRPPLVFSSDDAKLFLATWTRC